MKRYIAIALAAILALALMTGCGGEDTPTLKVAMSPDFAPMEFVDATKTGQDQFVGFDVSLAKYLAAEMGQKLEIVPMSFDACQNAVAMGQVDMAISGFSWMPDRAEKYNLSITYHAGDNQSNQVLLTIAQNAGLYATAESLNGLKVGAQTASLQEWLVQQQIPGAETVAYSDITTGIMQLRKGDFAVMAVAEGNADALIANNSDLVKSGFYFELTDDLQDNLILMKKGNDELTATVNDLLNKAAAAGLYTGWYAEALELAGMGVEITYDDQGNIATEGT